MLTSIVPVYSPMEQLRNKKNMSVAIELQKHRWKFGTTRNSKGTQAITGNSFYSFSPKLPQVFLYLKTKTENMFSILLEKYVMKTIQESKQFVHIDHQNMSYLCLCHENVNSSCQFCVYIDFQCQYTLSSILSQKPFSDWLHQSPSIL